MENFKLFLEKLEDPYDEEDWTDDDRFMVVIGDWSKDGHGEFDYFVYNSNYDVRILRQSYKDSCKLTGVQFNHNTDYTGIYNHRINRWSRICTEYGDNSIHGNAANILMNHGLDLNMFEDDGEGNFVVNSTLDFSELILRFIKLSLPDFKWEEASYKRYEIRQEIQPLNGYWNPDLNVQFGYGLFEIY